ncbi:MAG TPA: winged helix-turn-helix domain-containing protein [Candidatus Acidoferrum sp.]|nr:winged helix-turn-helix domain-containing protein [Candidatus Acidoferrum sp.]
MGNVLIPTRKTENNRDLVGMIKTLDSECRNCAPISPLQCINRCQVYKLKNELRKLRETMDNPNYIKELFNVLKNETRLHILQAIVNGRYSVNQLQQELKKTGHSHSQDTISEEYLGPLMSVGLATEARDEYYATSFGGRLTELLGVFPEFVEMLPAHSECYEEMLLQSLLEGPKTFEEIETLISPKIASRILKRLRSVGLIETPSERDYIFFFKSKRDLNKESLTATEREIYETIADEGISAGKLSKETGLSMRRTYKYLRGLKGKKLVFVRRTPKAYGLTCKGEMLASVLKGLQQIVEETWSSSEQVMNENSNS